LASSSALTTRRELLTGTFSLLSYLNHFSSSSSTSFRTTGFNVLIRDVFCSKALTILSLFSQIVWKLELTRH
jgi:hypothetical protein